jgi:alcohol dehydrogenase
MNGHAKAAVMTAPNTDLEIVDYPLPEVEPGAILVKVECCTICGSDIHSWSGRRPAPTPIILGHEIVGTVAEMGTEPMLDSLDQPLRIGDRITWTLMNSCGRCFFCRQKGLPMKCRALTKCGHDRCDVPPHFVGGFAEYAYVMPGTAVIRVPAELSAVEVAPANCALATVVAGWEAAELRPFENVLILGAGALGVYAAAFAAHAGCGRVIGTDTSARRLEFIRRFGATDTIAVGGMAEAALIREVRERTEGRGADCVMEVAGVPGLIPLGLKCLRIGGRLVEIGNSFPDANFTCDASDIVWRRLTIQGVHNYDARHLREGIQLLSQARDRFPFAEIVTHTVPLEAINAGLRLAQSGDAIRVAVIP